jgi:hypothetical protein
MGYSYAAIAALRGGIWMDAIRRCNILTAFVVIGIVLALFSPIADPVRISVNDQMARLQSGKVKPAQFDFAYLHSEGGRFGDAALKTLAKSANADVRKEAQYQIDILKPSAPMPPKNYDMASNVTVYPKGAALPPGFFKQNWANMQSTIGAPTCLITAGNKCDAILVDLDQDGVPEVIVADDNDAVWWGTVIKKQPDGSWGLVGFIPSPHCTGDLAALKAGKYQIVAPPGHVVQIGGHVLPIKTNDPPQPDCRP